MEIYKVFCLSILEGLTEFIPVSSTGHLILLGAYFGETSEFEKLFDVFIQLGAILAVVFLYNKKILTILADLKSAKLSSEVMQYGALQIILASLPPLIFGFLFYKYIKELLFYPKPVALALIVGGIGLLIVEKYFPEKIIQERITLKQAMVVGFFQSLALWPGMSRSGSCLIGARFAGISRILAAEFSFIVAIPIMFVAVLYDILKNYKLFFSQDILLLLLGFSIAMISGILAIKMFIAYLSRFSLVPFGYYRIVLGGLVLFLSY